MINKTSTVVIIAAIVLVGVGYLVWDSMKKPATTTTSTTPATESK